ncbi:hypothetical protein LJK88_37125 [Paenibacillus sp. P26]|nr:hypothetical protein LJK88_37125 [Paenibacillus sp. P26]
MLGTDPLKVDTNGNGINDGEEDADNDTISNAREIALGTSPVSKDTDLDEWDDGVEITKGTDPKNPDTDNDGIEDSKEEALPKGRDLCEARTGGREVRKKIAMCQAEVGEPGSA